MRKILFLPFLQIPSGHHQAADALAAGVQVINPSIHCKKVDILHYSFGHMEAAVSAAYLKWIHASPQTYNWTYQRAVCKNKKKEKRYTLYEWLFLPHLKKLLKEEKPDLIVCTHGLPSYMLERYKRMSGIKIPVINVYTDYFVHDLWGGKTIDYHFVASIQMKHQLIKNGIHPKNIFLTGIPIHPALQQETVRKQDRGLPISVLITGGSLGIGGIEELVNTLGNNRSVHYYVLCGKNEQLFHKLQNVNRVTPLPYIHSRSQMNTLYNQADAILTKPGGVTISECLRKNLPIFIYHSLPGQETINFQQLKQLGVAIDAVDWTRGQQVEEKVLSVIYHHKRKQHLLSRLRAYNQCVEYKNPSELLYKLAERFKSWELSTF